MQRDGSVRDKLCRNFTLDDCTIADEANGGVILLDSCSTGTSCSAQKSSYGHCSLGNGIGAPIRTELTVTKEGGGGFLGLFGSKKPAIRLGFEEQSEGPATRIHRTVSLADLAPGRYRVDVVVRNAEGGERRSVTTLEVRP